MILREIYNRIAKVFVEAWPAFLFVLILVVVLYEAERCSSKKAKAQVDKMFPAHPSKITIACLEISVSPRHSAREQFLLSEPHLDKHSYYCWANLVESECQYQITSDSIKKVDVKIVMDGKTIEMTFNEFGLYLFGV